MAALAYCTTGTEKKLAEANARVIAVKRPLLGEGIFIKPYRYLGLKGKVISSEAMKQTYACVNKIRSHIRASGVARFY